MNFLSRAAPLFSRLRPYIGRSNDFRQGYERAWELSPSVESIAPRAVFDESDLSKITGSSPDRPVADEIRAMYGGPIRHAATKAYAYRDAVLSRGNLFTSKMRLDVSMRQSPLLALKPSIEFDDAVLASSSYGVKYFGHWMCDDLPRLLAARDIGRPMSVLSNPSTGQQQYLDILGLATTDVCTDAFFRRIVVIDDNGQNAYKRARHLRLRVMASPIATPSPAPGVMLLRGKGGQRRLLENEAEVADYVRSRGFLVLDPATMPASEILRACIGVHIVLGVEGSQLSNGLMWMSRAGTCVVIQPPQRFVSVLKDHCDNLGIGYAFIVCDARESGNFHLDMSALGRMLDRVSG
jgi:hypothetical protein